VQILLEVDVDASLSPHALTGAWSSSRTCWSRGQGGGHYHFICCGSEDDPGPSSLTHTVL
jgi:hypothetical protein